MRNLFFSFFTFLVIFLVGLSASYADSSKSTSSSILERQEKAKAICLEMSKSLEREINEFRKNLKPGSVSSCGKVLNINGYIAQVKFVTDSGARILQVDLDSLYPYGFCSYNPESGFINTNVDSERAKIRNCYYDAMSIR